MTEEELAERLVREAFPHMRKNLEFLGDADGAIATRETKVSFKSDGVPYAGRVLIEVWKKPKELEPA